MGALRPAAISVASLPLLVIPAFAAGVGTSAAWYPRWAALIPGLFAQAGMAEEVLFRGYLFGHARENCRFWSAVFLAMVPFVAVHLILFLTIPWPVALAASTIASAIMPTQTLFGVLTAVNLGLAAFQSAPHAESARRDPGEWARDG